MCLRRNRGHSPVQRPRDAGGLGAAPGAGDDAGVT